jgi:uncharacterized protein (TIGR02284 family)
MPTEHDISVLNSLITTTIDSANGFENSAQDIESGQIQTFFSEMAQERRQVVGRLQEHVRMHGGTPNDDGSLKADLHRRFEDIRKAIGGGDKAVIEEVERGEDYLKDKYETALQDQQLSADCRQIVQEAYESVRRGHDRARDLKQGFQSV